MGNYDPLTTLRGWQGVSEIQNARVDRRARLAQLAEQERQMKEQQSIRDAAKASVTNVPGQSADLGTFRAGGADLPMGSVGMAPHSEFDTQGFSGRLKAINPLMGQEYDQNQAAIEQKQQDAVLERQQKLVTLQNGLADLATKDRATFDAKVKQINEANDFQGRLAYMVKNAPPEQKAVAYQYARKAALENPLTAQQAQSLPEQYSPEIEPQLDQMIASSVDVKTLLGNVTQQATQSETARHNKETEANTRRGQNMTDSRQREFNVISQQNKAQRPPNEGERNAFSFYKRAADAEKVLTEFEPKIASMGLGGQIGRAVLPNVLQSDDNQVYQQAQRQFTQAKLRRESGAAISQSEYDQDAKTYFPNPGDSKAVLQRKAAARQAIMDELKTASGRAYTETFGDNSPANTPYPGKKPAPSGGNFNWDAHPVIK